MAESKTNAPQKAAETTRIAKPAASSESAVPAKPRSVAKEPAAPKTIRRRKTTTEASTVSAEVPRPSKAESTEPKLEGETAAPKRVAPAKKTQSTSTVPAAKKAEEAPKPAILAEKPKAARSTRKLSKSDVAKIEHMIAEAAYYLAEKRNFAPGFEDEDWAKATAEVMARLKKG